MTKPISYVSQAMPPVSNYSVNSNPGKKTLTGANFTPPARNIQSQLGRPPSTHVDEFEKSKISIKAQSGETQADTKEITPIQGEIIPRTPSPIKLKEHHLVYNNKKLLKILIFI